MIFGNSNQCRIPSSFRTMKVQFIKKNQPASRLVFFNELHFHG